MPRCFHCGKSSKKIAECLQLCYTCLRDHFSEIREKIDSVHATSHHLHDLPPFPPQDPEAPACTLCVNSCRIPVGRRGYCGVRSNKGGRILGGTAEGGDLYYYYDSLPTNCVADWVCPGGTGAGYPKFAYRPGPELGYKNLAVFYHGCTFDCLFCQNWQHRQSLGKTQPVSSQALAGAVDEATSCICYFGGDPTPHLIHSMQTARIARKQAQGKILRICWETNGSGNSAILEEIMDLALESGGCIKFDLKAWTEGVHIALCGVSNQRTLKNFKRLSWKIAERPQPPPLVASTLLVPGYVDEEEIREIARFIASLDRTIPYSLLAFHPQFFMKDLPTTSRKHAERCLDLAQEAGLKRVRLGNLHLLREGEEE